MFQYPDAVFDTTTADNECRDGDITDGASLRGLLTKTRSLSDGGRTPKLSPSPYIFEAARRQSKDDSTIPDREFASTHGMHGAQPSTPVRAALPLRGLAFQMPAGEPTSPARQPSSPYVKPTPLSPKLDHSQIYASPTNILPRRSRGLEFSRAATSLHHSNTHMLSESSSSSDEDDCMDEDMEEPYLVTPHVPQTIMGSPWMSGNGSPAATGLPSFQQRQRPRRQRSSRKARGLPGLGFVPASTQHMMSRSPPNNMTAKDLASLHARRESLPNNVTAKDLASLHARRESISWAANQLHISGSESDDNLKSHVDVDSPSRPGVVRRVVHRNGNLLPKTKGFARIRAALAEENQPVESEFRREAEVIRQVRESDMDLEPRPQPPHSAATTTLSSPKLTTQDIDELTDDAMMMVDSATGSGSHVSGSFKQQALKNSKGKVFWDTFSESSTGAARTTTTPPPPSLGPARASSSGAGLEDASMDSPSASSTGTSSYPFISPFPNPISDISGLQGGAAVGVTGCMPLYPAPPSAAEITRRFHKKRRRDDDFDPASVKRRACSPNSPVMQSPLQRDIASWGSRAGSVGGDSAKPGGAASEGSGGGSGRASGSNRRVGYQGMVDTNDGITRLSIE